jgi:site-specific DNA-methyltransferase (adenine-specific)
MSIKVLHGDCKAVMASMEENSVDAIVTDPPYGLEFMGKEWDAPWKSDRRQIFDGTLKDDRDAPFTRQKVRYGFGASYGAKNEAMLYFQEWAREIFVEAYRVLKPGGHVFAFGGSKTYHRLTCAIEDAGFEIRDCVMYVFGTGFPKSHDVSKAIDKTLGVKRETVGNMSVPGYAKANVENGQQKRNTTVFTRVSDIPSSDEAAIWQGWGTALKPAYESIVLARKPLIGTVAQNVMQYGTGALNIDGCRVGTSKRVPGSLSVTPNKVYGSGLGGYSQDGTESGHDPNIGRWPANLIHDGSEEVVSLFPNSKGQQGDVKGTEPSRTGDDGTNCYGEYERVPFKKRNEPESSAARFFYNTRDGEASAEKTYSDSGATNFAMKPGNRRDQEDTPARFFYCAKASKKDRNGSNHPTVKPQALMRYLIKMITPPGGVVLDPFAGSGSTGWAADDLGFDCILIEKEPEYVEHIRKIVEQRLDAPKEIQQSELDLK